MSLRRPRGLVATTSGPGIDVAEPSRSPTNKDLTSTSRVSHARATTDGRGRGWRRQSAAGAIRRAQGVGTDTITLRVRKEPSPTAPVTTASAPAAEDVPALPSIVLDAKPLASGLFDQIGLPTGGVMSGASTGPGSGGGVGTGSGTGIRLGTWSRIRPGIRRRNWRWHLPRWRDSIGAAPDQRSQAQLHEEALLQRIQGTVVLEVIVTADGCASQIRIVRSLDAGGLDEEAVVAVAQWRFEPGRLGAAPVNVLVRIRSTSVIR